MNEGNMMDSTHANPALLPTNELILLRLKNMRQVRLASNPGKGVI